MGGKGVRGSCRRAFLFPIILQRIIFEVHREEVPQTYWGPAHPSTAFLQPGCHTNVLADTAQNSLSHTLLPLPSEWDAEHTNTQKEKLKSEWPESESKALNKSWKTQMEDHHSRQKERHTSMNPKMCCQTLSVCLYIYQWSVRQHKVHISHPDRYLDFHINEQQERIEAKNKPTSRYVAWLTREMTQITWLHSNMFNTKCHFSYELNY